MSSRPVRRGSGTGGALAVTGAKGVYAVHAAGPVPDQLVTAARALTGGSGHAGAGAGTVTVLVGAGFDDIEALCGQLAPVMEECRDAGTTLVRLVMSGAAADAPERPGPARRLSERWEFDVLAPAGAAVVVPGGTLFAPDLPGTVGGWWKFSAARLPRHLGPRHPVPGWQLALDRVALDTAVGCTVEHIPAGLLVSPAGARPEGVEAIRYALPVDPAGPVLLVDTAGTVPVPAEILADLVAALPAPVRGTVRLVASDGSDLLATGQEVADLLGTEVQVANGLPVLLEEARATSPVRGPVRGSASADSPWGEPIRGGAVRTVLVDPEGNPSWQPYVKTVTCLPADGPQAPAPRIGTWRAPIGGLRPGSEAGTLLLDAKWQVTVTRAGLWIGPHGTRLPAAAVTRPVEPDVMSIDLGAPGHPLDPSLWQPLERLFAALQDDVRSRTVIQLLAAPDPVGLRTLRRLAIRHDLALSPGGRRPLAQSPAARPGAPAAARGGGSGAAAGGPVGAPAAAPGRTSGAVVEPVVEPVAEPVAPAAEIPKPLQEHASWAPVPERSAQPMPTSTEPDHEAPAPAASPSGPTQTALPESSPQPRPTENVGSRGAPGPGAAQVPSAGSGAIEARPLPEARPTVTGSDGVAALSPKSAEPDGSLPAAGERPEVPARSLIPGLGRPGGAAAEGASSPHSTPAVPAAGPLPRPAAAGSDGSAFGAAEAGSFGGRERAEGPASLPVSESTRLERVAAEDLSAGAAPGGAGTLPEARLKITGSDGPASRGAGETSPSSVPEPARAELDAPGTHPSGSGDGDPYPPVAPREGMVSPAGEAAAPWGGPGPGEAEPGPGPVEASPLRGVTWVPVRPSHRSSAAEREAVRGYLGARWDYHGGAVTRALTRVPALRSGEYPEEVAADLGALHAYVTGGAAAQSELSDALAAGGTDLLPYLGCVASGLRRLPSYRGAAVRSAGGLLGEAAELLLPGEELGEATPVSAVGFDKGYPSVPADHYLIWSMTGHKAGPLLSEAEVEAAASGAPGGPHGSPEEVLFGPGARLRVLQVERRAGATVVLLRELPESAPPAPPGHLDAADNAVLKRLQVLTDQPTAVGSGQEWPARCAGVLGVLAPAEPPPT